MSKRTMLSVNTPTDLILAGVSRIPPSAQLDHAVRFLGTWSGSDKFFMLIENTAKLLVPLLESRAVASYKSGGKAIPKSEVALRLKNLGSLISDSRTLLRLWGLLPIIQWLLSLSRTPPPTRSLKTIETLQALSMLVYYPLEHLSFLSTKKVISLSPTCTTKYSLWSSRAWAIYVVLQFLHLREDWGLVMMRERALKRDARTTITTATTSSTREGEKQLGASMSAYAEEQHLQAEILKRKSAIINELIVNLGYLPLTVHWSLKTGLFKNDVWVHVFGMIAAVYSFRGSWRASRGL
ncbi:hypothetical protein M408DRAFT_329981 [Serendipita vermifera MAFF 305830]|uniref:Uncharacterized protein n=1 Tax=Serendipita vermifera MAFF 305830 TaxID=933852 RepID=A0A0C3B5S4_SERVB|nr:hypothetical protein M408DRAFT_329981 [Serendipita vermifera MAFF 305830]